jgi:hypothetical protein
MTNLSNVLAMPWTATNDTECGQAFALIRRTPSAFHKKLVPFDIFVVDYHYD